MGGEWSCRWRAIWTGVADDAQQHLDDHRGIEIDAAGHALEAVLALDKCGAPCGERGGPHGDSRRKRSSLSVHIASDSRTRRVRVWSREKRAAPDREQAEAVEALWVEEGAEAVVAVVAARVADLAEVAEGCGGTVVHGLHAGVRTGSCRVRDGTNAGVYDVCGEVHRGPRHSRWKADGKAVPEAIDGVPVALEGCELDQC